MTSTLTAMAKPRKDALMATCGARIVSAIALIRFIASHRLTHLVVVVPQHKPYDHVNKGVVQKWTPEDGAPHLWHHSKKILGHRGNQD